MSSFSWTWHEGSASSIRRGYGANWNDYPAVKVDVVSVPWTPGWRPGNCLSGRPATVLVSGSQSSLPAAALGAISVADCVPPQRAHEYSSLKVYLPTRPVLSKTRGKPATGLLPIELPIIGCREGRQIRTSSATIALSRPPPGPNRRNRGPGGNVGQPSLATFRRGDSPESEPTPTDSTAEILGPPFATSSE